MRLRQYISTLLLVIYTIAIGGTFLDAFTPCKCGHTYKCESGHNSSHHTHDDGGCSCGCAENNGFVAHRVQINDGHCAHVSYVDENLYISNSNQNESTLNSRLFAFDKYINSQLDFVFECICLVKLNALEYSYSPLLLEQISKSAGFRAPPVLA